MCHYLFVVVCNVTQVFVWLTWQKAPGNKILRMFLVTGFHNKHMKERMPQINPAERTKLYLKEMYDFECLWSVTITHAFLIGPRSPHLGNIPKESQRYKRHWFIAADGFHGWFEWWRSVNQVSCSSSVDGNEKSPFGDKFRNSVSHCRCAKLPQTILGHSLPKQDHLFAFFARSTKIFGCWEESVSASILYFVSETWDEFQRCVVL
jgi:hypothetical protein